MHLRSGDSGLFEGAPIGMQRFVAERNPAEGFEKCDDQGKLTVEYMERLKEAIREQTEQMKWQHARSRRIVSRENACRGQKQG